MMYNQERFLFLSMFKRSLIFIFVYSFLIIGHAAEPESVTRLCAKFRAEPESTGTTPPAINTNFDKGLLWKIEKDDKVNYLFGTMHSQDYAVSKFPPKVRLALVKSKTLILETIPNEAANQTFIDMMYFKDGQQLDSLLETTLYEELSKRIQGYGVPSEKIKYLKAWAAFSLIGRPKPVRAPTLETNLLRFAQQRITDIQSLETMEEILSALDKLTIEDQLIILKDTICNHDKIIRETKTLVDLYVDRDLAGIAAYNKQSHYDEAVFDRFMQNILYDRNIRMLERIDEAFTQGNVFVAVGASHLAEEKGLLKTLSDKGYGLTLLY